MGKKDREEMANQREKFRSGAIQKGIDPDLAMKIFDKIEKFASYGFNKSHAAAYGYLAYVTAYLKSNYPGEWMAALMTCDRDDVAKVAKLIGESQAMNIPILPPDVNESGHEFAATSKGIRFAMGGIKGVGEGVVEAILEERRLKGPFRTLFDFCSRIDTKKIGKKTIECLIEAGCFDFTAAHRQSMIASLEEMYQAAVQKQKEISKGFIDLFGEAADQVPAAPLEHTETVLSKQHVLRREKELLGFYVTGHPLDEFKALILRLSCLPFGQIVQLEHDAVLRAAFIVDNVQVKISGKTQKKFAILKISDGNDRFELPVWPELFEEKGHLLIDNQLLYAILQVDRREGDLKLQCRWLDDLTRADEEMMKACETAFDQLKMQQKNMARRDRKGPPKQEKKEMKGRLFLKLNADHVRHSHVLHLKKLFRSYPGSTPLILEFLSSNQTVAHVVVDARWGVSLEQELEQQLRKLPFLVHVEVRP
jgi:DNA polymerase-3 subunit alpha